jgi:hypothetical protein
MFHIHHGLKFEILDLILFYLNCLYVWWIGVWSRV